MQRLRGGLVGVDGGTLELFSDFEDGGEMWTGRGQRERQRHIKFGEPFRRPPQVQISISLWDMDAGNVLRADLSAESVTEDGFNIVFRTWGDSRVARVNVTWMAVGELLGEEDWDV